MLVKPSLSRLLISSHTMRVVDVSGSIWPLVLLQSYVSRLLWGVVGVVMCVTVGTADTAVRFHSKRVGYSLLGDTAPESHGSPHPFLFTSPLTGLGTGTWHGGDSRPGSLWAGCVAAGAHNASTDQSVGSLG